MATESPQPLSAAELLERQNRVVLIAQTLGFAGTLEYRHVFREGTGGAQYGRGVSEPNDLLIVDAKAFERDADAEDFSLEVMIAHERGHQILAWHPRIAKRVAGIPLLSEEILASVLGSILCARDVDRELLLAKAAFELVMCGKPSKDADRLVQTLREALEAML